VLADMAPSAKAATAGAGAPSPFDFSRLWDEDDAAAAPMTTAQAMPTGGTTTSAGAITPATARRASGAGPAPGSGTSGSTGRSSGSSNKPSPISRIAATGLSSAASDRARPSRTPRTDPPSVDGDGPEDINELLGLIGDRLNRRFDSKKRKLESFAEKALNDAQRSCCASLHSIVRIALIWVRGGGHHAGTLDEHTRQHYDALDKKIAEHTQRLQGHFAAAAAERNRLKQLQDGYQVRVRSTMPSLQALTRPSRDTSARLRRCWPRWSKSTQAFRRRKSAGRPSCKS
jgi:hypothetical protein